METPEIGIALKSEAEGWTTSPFDAASLAAESDARRRSRRRWAGLATVGLVLAVALIGALALRTDRSPHTAPIAGPSPTKLTASPGCCGLRPASPPDVQIVPLTTIGTIGSQPVLARIQAGNPITVSARLSFLDTATQQPVEAAALVVAVPGTTAGVDGKDYDSYYDSTRVTEGQPVRATAPETQVLNVTAPATLLPGTYPVFAVVRTGLAPGQQPGYTGPFNLSFQLGVIVLTAP